MFLQAEDKKLKSEGKPGITIRAYSAPNASYQALLAGQLDAVVGGYTALAGVDKQLSSKVQYGLSAQVNVLPIGIVSAKTNPQLNAAFKKGIAEMYKDGSMASILKKWGISLTAFSKPPTP